MWPRLSLEVQYSMCRIKSDELNTQAWHKRFATGTMPGDWEWYKTLQTRLEHSVWNLGWVLGGFGRMGSGRLIIGRSGHSMWSMSWSWRTPLTFPSLYLSFPFFSFPLLSSPLSTLSPLSPLLPFPSLPLPPFFSPHSHFPFPPPSSFHIPSY